MTERYELLIIGGGPAGLTAALYGARGGLKTAYLEMSIPGGQAATTDTIENYPGFPEGINGPELMGKFAEQAEKFGAVQLWATVESVNFSLEEKLVYAGNEVYQAPVVIIASGSRSRLLGIPGENEFRGRGVSYCATCDGAFFKDKKVLVFGGGDSALEEALFLTKFASEVVIVHRRQGLRAARVLVDRSRSNPRLSFRLEKTAEEILGSDRVTSVVLRDVTTGQMVEETTDGVFVFIGTLPNTDFLSQAVILDEEGYVVTGEDLQTSVPGVFAAGDVRAKFLRQVSTAVGDGALAAMAAERFLVSNLS